jgi:hypothetical protein
MIIDWTNQTLYVDGPVSFVLYYNTGTDELNAILVSYGVVYQNPRPNINKKMIIPRISEFRISI